MKLHLEVWENILACVQFRSDCYVHVLHGNEGVTFQHTLLPSVISRKFCSLYIFPLDDCLIELKNCWIIVLTRYEKHKCESIL
jgi:hypothetical protein